MSVRGLVRLHLVEASRPALYVSPIQIDPRAPAGPISSPAGYAADLAGRIGLYHTIGMPEETWSLNEERISDDAYLDMVATILEEREAMFFDTLERRTASWSCRCSCRPIGSATCSGAGLTRSIRSTMQTDERARARDRVDLRRGGSHPGPGTRCHAARGPPDRAQRPWLRFVPARALTSTAGSPRRAIWR